MREKWEPRALWVGVQTTAANGEHMAVSLRMTQRSALWAPNSTSGLILKRAEGRDANRYLHPRVQRSASCNSQGVEAQCLLEDGGSIHAMDCYSPGRGAWGSHLQVSVPFLHCPLLSDVGRRHGGSGEEFLWGGR